MKKWTKLTLWGVLIALAMAALVAPFASSLPDGLEKVAETKGFAAKATALFESIMPDYLIPGIRNERIGTALAGIIGTLLVFSFVFILARLLAKRGGRRAS